MNCPSFLNNLHEYVEDSLSPDERQAMEAHLAECAGCHRLLQQEQAAALVLAKEFRQSTQHLILPPGFQARLLNTLRQEAVAPAITIPTIRKSNWLDFLWPSAIAAGVLLTAFQSVRLFPGAPSTELAEGERVAPPVAELSIQCSFQVPTWKFRREGNLVVDTLSYETVVASETLPVRDHLSTSQKPETKTPL